MPFPRLTCLAAAIALLTPASPVLADTVEVRPPDVSRIPQDRRQSLFDEAVATSVSLEVCATTPDDLTVEEAEILWISGLALAESQGISESELYATHYERARRMFDSQPERCAHYSGNLRPLVMTLVGYGAAPVFTE
ncbi:hypothetical protein [Pararhodobacter marinus]|uniref:hypothetical protein n=1 Tax=Pararhodobacter marinus TaxID=2184063 RepID=UPI0035177CB0